ncbi:zinc finger protein 1035 [Etheostoma cragini]|uniref:zinc finger protein 1035 n=1 Tax=Etheostoma cragini TaxID=417921 RepID=UPI00155EFE54|nr:zinc finger protein 1035 [Etheostoma cragini]XP_034731243.1 zinc finger protein 1035 [Etheostoma cragini]
MANGWDSYFHNIPPLSSDPSTLRRTSESEGSLSQHIENLIGHHDFPNPLSSHDAPATNLNFNTNYNSNSSIENTSQDCLYQRYCKETPWQADVNQMEKDYLPRCGNSISDFGADGLLTLESYPSSFTTDLQELKQDCGMLATSFLEDYSDVSSCSEAEVGETRPSCKFMASNSVPKPKTGIATPHSSSEWLFTDTGNVMLQTESLCPNMLKTNVILPSTSNVNTGENKVEWAKDKMEENVKSYTGHPRFSTTFSMGTTTGSETVEDIKDHGGCPDQTREEYVERALTQGKNSNLSMSGHESLAFDGIKDYPDGNEEAQIAATAPNSMTTLDNEQDHSDEKVLRKEIKDLFDQKIDSPNPIGCHDSSREDAQEKSDLKIEGKESGAFEIQVFDEQKSLNPNPTDGQDENMETNFQEKEIQSNAYESSDPLIMNVSDSKDVTCELRECKSTLNINNDDVESCLLKSVTKDNICGSHAVISDISNASDKNEQCVASHPESCLQPNSLSTNVNPCSKNELTSAAEKKTTPSSIEPFCADHPVTSDSKEPSVSNGLESCSQSNTSSTDLNPCLQKEGTSPAEITNATSPDQQQPPHQSLVDKQTGSLNVDIAKKATESVELDTSAVDPSVLGVLYGEPLSRDDSSCDADETKLDSSHDKDSPGADSNGINYTEGQAPQRKFSIQMRKRLQPVIILKTSEPVNGMSNSYHCADCKHTTHNVDDLIEHHHCCHSVHNFQFCKTCNLYLMGKEQAEKHVCCLTKESPHLSSDSNLSKKRKHCRSLRCNKCKLIFSKMVHYVKHMRTHTGKTPYKCNGCDSYFAQSCSLRRHKRIPGRCKQLNLPVTDSDVVIKETKTPPQKDLIPFKPYPNLPECYVKLVDISKSHLCSVCGKSFITADKSKKHFHNVHKGKGLTVSSSKCTAKRNGGKSQKSENETTGLYKCPLCPRLFKYSYNRARHLRDCVRETISGGKEKIAGKYLCPLCHVTFTLPSNRYRHIKTFCLRECVNRLAKERVKSKEKIEPKKTKGIKQKTQLNKNEKNKRLKVMETKKEALPYYKCNLCPAIFYHASGKYRHMKKHELFKLTGKMFKYRNSLLSTLPKPATSSTTMTGVSNDSKSSEANGSLALICNFCEKCFDTPQLLKKHERNHRGQRPYRCLECRKGFKKRASLIGHKSVHQRRIQCTVCRKILPTIGELIKHRSSHINRGKLQCPDCDQQFQYPAYLLRHLDTHKQKANKISPLDERPPLKPQQSMESVKEQSGPKRLQCSLCKEVFNHPQVLRKHCLTHISGLSTNQCPFCNHHFRSRRYLLRHMIKHTGDKPFSCSNCGKQFYRDLYLKLHHEKCLPGQARNLVTMESDTKKKGPHQCSYCPRRFFKIIRLKNHHRGHKTNTLLLCSRCGQYFGFTKINQHQRDCRETTELNMDLSPDGDVCKSTSQRSRAPTPLRSNATKVLPFKCSHCTQRFRYRSLLLRHLISHTGVQPYACMHCGHRYRSRIMCLQHEAFCDGVEKGQSKVKGEAAVQLSKTPTLREAAQKPRTEVGSEYKCKFCTKTFMKSQSLRRHILTHNEVKPYRCKACDSCFSRYDHLEVHQTRCRGKITRLEVCIPKISLDDVGKGWQNRFCLEPAEKKETFGCEVCSRSFPAQSKLSRHVTLFHAIKQFKCTRCSSSFSHEKSLKKHLKTRRCRRISKETILETNTPTENVTTPLKAVRNRIIQRINPYLNNKHKYVCSHCPRAFGNSWQLDVHNRLHTGERPYACDYCGERFIRKDYMQRHSTKCPKKNPGLSKSTVGQLQQSTSKSPPKGFSCAYCSSRFLLFSQLQEHFLNAHQLETKVPPVSTAPLQHHLLNIPKVKEEPLDENCDEQLSDAANLICKLDTSVDNEIPNTFSCPKCTMTFTNKAGLTGHLRVHTMKCPFNCKICNRGFWNKSLLRNHNRKCRFGRISKRSETQQLEVPLKAQIDFVLNDSVLVFKEASTSSGTGVLQTNFSHKDAVMDESPQNSEENQVQSSSSKVKKAVQYQCSECDMSFTDGLMLISHLEDHGRQEQAKKRNSCIKCGQVFASQGNLERHMKLHENNREYSCPDCSKVVYTQSDLEIHRTCHDQSRPFACKLCNYRFWKRPSLCNHYREEHPDDAFTCRFCNKAYSVKKSLARHYRKWHKKEQLDFGRTLPEKCSTEQSSGQVSTTGESGEDENDGSEDSDSDSAPYFPCHVCGKTFPTSESLEDHQRCHLGEKPHECAECGRCFFQASQLQQHQRMHKSEFQCQACGRGFVSLFALRNHKHTHGKSRPYRCSKCDFSFTGPSQLAEHMSTHREENFPCDICNLVFPSKSSRAEHRTSHSKSGDRPPPSISREELEKAASHTESSFVSPKELKYRCGVCSQRFRDPEELSEHGCMAAKERPYSCSDCNKHFLHESHLKKHKTTHQPSSSSSEYPCNQCNNSFFSSWQHFHSHLMSHVDSSAETKHNSKSNDEDLSHGFICPVCHQCFASATELMCHFPTHPDGTFECNICKMTFPSESKLKEHNHTHVISNTEFECTDCGQSFWGKDAFCQHHCSHQQQSTMKAEYSSPSARTSPPTFYQAEEEEEIDVTGEDLHNCPVCSMQFYSKSDLLEHQNKQHQREKPFECQLCGKTFARKRYLREHERRHRQKDPVQLESKLKCSAIRCHSEFNSAHALSLHMRLHAEKEVGEYRCEMCYKSFSQWSHLKQHQESHVGQVVYECTECDKAFAFPHLLEEHQQTHAGSSQ